MTKQYARLTDSQWNKVKRFLDLKRKRKHSLRNVLDAILWIVRTGCQWRNLPAQFPPWKTVHYYLSKWSRTHIMESINEALNRLERQLLNNREETPSLLLIDAQSVRLSPMIGTARGIDGGKWINGRKRTILTDTLGRIWRVEVHAANIYDGIAGCDIIDPNFTAQLPRAKVLLADKAYRGQFEEKMSRLDSVAFECPTRAEGVKGFVVEKRRWVVERSFAWMNFFRRITKDLERTVENSAGFILAANIQMVLSSIERLEDENF
ncbi:MAG: IS5 family transposase [Bacteroidota bacterium]